MGAAQVKDRLDGLHLDARTGEFEALGAEAGLHDADEGAQPVGHAAKRQAACGAGGVFHEAPDGRHAFAAVGQRGGGEAVFDQRQQVGAARVAHDDPLVTIAAHVAHGDVGKAVGVIDAGLAGHREEIVGKLADGELQERDQPWLAAIVKAQFHFEIGAEFQIADGFWGAVEQVEEGMEVLGRGVVRAGRANDVEGVKAQFSL